MKRKYRRTKLGSLRQIAQVVNDSAVCNVAQLVASDDGTMIVPTYNWTDFFATRMKKVPGIKKYHHFSFKSDNPGGVIYLKLRSDSEAENFHILKEPRHPDPDNFPAVVTPKYLSAERQWYLYNQIRPFCPESDRDVTCPLSEVPQTGSRHATPSPTPEVSAAILLETAPPTKRKRLCGLC